MKRESIEASAQAIAKAKEMQEKVIELFNQVKNENKSIQDIIRTDLQATQKWNEEQIDTIISNLQKGIETYHTQRNSVNEGTEALSIEQLEQALTNIPVEQQKDKLIAMLSVLAFVKDTDSDLTQLRNDWELMSIDALKDMVIGYANKNDTYDNVIEKLKEGIENLNLSELNLPEQFGEISDDYKLYVATQIFIEADNIDAQNLEGQAQTIGATSAAAVDIARETARWQNGEISEKTWHYIVKGILAVLAVCVISFIAVALAMDLLGGIFLLFTTIFGFSTITAILGMILGYAFVAGFLYLLYCGFDSIDGDIIESIDAGIEKVLCKIDTWIEELKEKLSIIVEKLRKKFSGQGQSENGNESPIGETPTNDTPVSTPEENSQNETSINNNPTQVPTSGN